MTAKNVSQVIAIDWDHNNVHEEKFFTTGYIADVAGSGAMDILIVTPDSDTKLHIYYGYEVEGEIVFTLYEGVTASNNGTALSVVNRDRNSVKAPVGAAYHTPTITDTGVQLFRWHSGSGKTVGGGATSGSEFIAKRNTKYLFRIANETVSLNYISIRFDWYEQPAT